MTYEPRSIGDHIDCLARLTGAPDTFVQQVRQVFDRKGISLGDDAGPYLRALEEAFKREECIRSSNARAQRSLASMQQNFQRIGRAYVDRLSQGGRKPAALASESTRLRGSVNALRADDVQQVTIKGDHRTLVTPLVREELPMVPGPEEIQ